MGQFWRAAAFLLLLTFDCAATRAQDAVIGEVVALRGACTVVRAAGTTALAVGAPILRADRIVTGPDGRIKVRFGDGTVIAIGSGSELVAADYAAQGGSRRSAFFSVIQGLFRATVTPGLPNSRFEVQTSTAVASVRSTDWMAQASVENTGVVVLDGAVEVASRPPAPREAVLLRAGEGTDVPAAAVPTGPARWSQRRIDALLAATAVP